MKLSNPDQMKSIPYAAWRFEPWESFSLEELKYLCPHFLKEATNRMNAALLWTENYNKWKAEGENVELLGRNILEITEYAIMYFEQHWRMRKYLAAQKDLYKI